MMISLKNDREEIHMKHSSMIIEVGSNIVEQTLIQNQRCEMIKGRIDDSERKMYVP